MGRIIYQGKEYGYDELPPIIANAIILTEEEAEKYNILLSPDKEEAVELNRGERIFVGDPWNNIVVHGVNVVQAKDDEDFRNKIQPSDAYTEIKFRGEISGGVYEENATVNKVVFVNKDYEKNEFSIGFQTTFYDSNNHLYPTLQDLKDKLGKDGEDLLNSGILTFSEPPSAYGVVLRLKNFTTGWDSTTKNAVIIRPYLVGWTYSEEEKRYTLLDLKELKKYFYTPGYRTSYSVNALREYNTYAYPSSGNAIDKSANLLTFQTDAEYDYAMGIKGRYTYVDQKTFEEAVSGSGE